MDPVRDVTGRHAQDGGPGLPRTHLIDELVSARTARVVLLQAPAGYSKTTTLKLWAEADHRPFAWVRAERRHDDPAVLIEAVAKALGPHHEIDRAVESALRSPNLDFDLVLRRMGTEIGRRDPFVLVIDDAQKIKAGTAWQVLQMLAGELPEGSKLAIGTRSPPGFSIAKLRVHGEILEIDMGKLALTRSESRSLLKGLGLRPGGQMDEIHHLTEGWPAGVFLTGLALRDGGKPSSGVLIGEGRRALLDYFREEYLEGLPEDRVQFLSRTAILEELNGPLCDAVTGRDDAARILEGLAREDALVVPIDGKQGIYRYRQLFAEMLLSELRVREPEVEPGLHGRAAAWFATNGHLPEATDHAIASGDFELAGALIWLDFLAITGRGRIATLDGWLNSIGPDRIARIPALILSRLHREIIVGRGEEAHYWLSVAEREIDERSDSRGDLLVARAMIGIDGPRGMIENASRAADLLALTDPWQIPAKLFRGIGMFLEEDAGAERFLRDASREAVAISPGFHALALSQLALCVLEQGRPQEAHDHVARARDQVEGSGLGSFREMSVVYSALALILARRGRPDEALDALGRSTRMSDEVREYIEWYEAQLLILNGRTLQRLGRFEAAAGLIARAEEATERASNPPLLVGWLEEARLALARPDIDAVNLTRAEVRTLGFLSSHHTFRAIGDQLGLSQNTVKTHAISVYRKLGVNSRADAVEEARRLGLLDAVEGRQPE